MLQREDILKMLEKALHDTQLGDKRSVFSLELQLTGKDGVFDSLDAMIFLDNVDEQIAQRCGRDVMLMNDGALSKPQSPFRSMGSLAAYIEEITADI